MRAGGDSAPAPRLACSCGAWRARLDPAALRGGTRLICHCADCRAAERHLGQPDPGGAGVDLFQTTPDMLTIEAGQLGLFRLRPNGLFRWHAACCGAPVGNTLKTPKLPFVALCVARFDDSAALGPVQVRGFVPRRSGTPVHEGAGRMVLGIATRALAAHLSGRCRQTPFFDIETGAPSAPAQVLDKASRAALG
ncbi:MAG TPA: hypothetical protein DEA05_11745 [Rhodobacteraceae bacterium]|jgi:hypothetical protein|nr:hypothetical protein [Paracoccaceae bacterium]